MKEHPILFRGNGIRAILDDRKTQTRRVIKPQPKMIGHPVAGTAIPYRRAVEDWEITAKDEILCPYGQPGDHLWVRETFQNAGIFTYSDAKKLTSVIGYPDGQGIIYRASETSSVYVPGWKSSTCMPRWASRITLEITGVRIEQVQDISEHDAKEEGAQAIPWYPGGHISYRNGFATSWDRVNAKSGFGWDANPWVWVIGFKRVEEISDGNTNLR